MDTWNFSYSTETLKKAFTFFEIMEFKHIPNIQQVLSMSIDDFEYLKMVYDIYRFYELKHGSE